MSASNETVIQTHGLSKSYGTVQALTGLDLSVPKNSIVGFLGPNGSGKSTTIKLLLGLIRPSAGSGTVFGLDIVRDSLAIRRRVGYLAQQPRYYNEMTARELLRFTAGLFFSGSRAAIEERIEEVMTLVGLADKADRVIKGFSGGERQRLGIAQAQINYPDLLILDEPAAALDPMGRRDVLQIMERLRKHTTIFYSTHILDDVQRVSDQVVILNHGKLVTQGPIEELTRSQDGTVFSLLAAGDLARAEHQVTAQPWVIDLHSERQNGHTRWQVTVNDKQAAEAHLLRSVLADPAINVLEFGQQTAELEDIFMDLVQEG